MVKLTKLASSKVYKDTKYVVLKEKNFLWQTCLSEQDRLWQTKASPVGTPRWPQGQAHCVKGDVKERVEKPNRKITFSSSTISCEDREKGDRLFLEMHNEKTTGNRQAPPGKSQLYIRKK